MSLVPQEARSWKVVEVLLHGSTREALLEYDAVNNLMPTSFYTRLSVKAKPNNDTTMVTDGDQLTFMPTCRESSACFANIILATDIFVLYLTLSHVVVATSVLYSLSACLDAVLKHMILTVGGENEPLPYESN